MVVWFIRVRGFIHVRSGGRRVHFSWSGSLSRSPGVVAWSGSFGTVGFVRLRHGCRRVHIGSFGPFWRVLRMVGFIRARWVHSRSYLGSTGSLALVHFISRTLVVVSFIRVRWIHSCAFLRSSGSFRFTPGSRWIHSCSFDVSRQWSCSLGSFEFILSHFGCRRVHSGLYG